MTPRKMIPRIPREQTVKTFKPKEEEVPAPGTIHVLKELKTNKKLWRPNNKSKKEPKIKRDF